MKITMCLICQQKDLFFAQKAGTDLNKTIEIFANPSFDQSSTNDSNIAQVQASSLRTEYEPECSSRLRRRGVQTICLISKRRPTSGKTKFRDQNES